MNKNLIEIFNRSKEKEELPKDKFIYSSIVNFLMIEDEFWYCYDTNNQKRLEYIAPILNNKRNDIEKYIEVFDLLNNIKGFKDKLYLLALSNLFKVIDLPDEYLNSFIDFDYKLLNKKNEFEPKKVFDKLCTKYLFLENIYIECGTESLKRCTNLNNKFYKLTNNEIYDVLDETIENIILNLFLNNKLNNESILDILLNLYKKDNKKLIKNKKY